MNGIYIFCMLMLDFICYGQIRKIEQNIINSKVLPGNLLPGFFFMQGQVESGQSVVIGGGE